jgi:hypothetical protein
LSTGCELRWRFIFQLSAAAQHQSHYKKASQAATTRLGHGGAAPSETPAPPVHPNLCARCYTLFLLIKGKDRRISGAIRKKAGYFRLAID